MTLVQYLKLGGGENNKIRLKKNWYMQQLYILSSSSTLHT